MRLGEVERAMLCGETAVASSGSDLFVFEERPRSSADWSLLGALIDERLKSY